MNASKCHLLGAIVMMAYLMPSSARAEMGDFMIHGMIMAEALEYGFSNGTDPLAWDVMAWVGGDEDSIQLMTEGELATEPTSDLRALAGLRFWY